MNRSVAGAAPSLDVVAAFGAWLGLESRSIRRAELRAFGGRIMMDREDCCLILSAADWIYAAHSRLRVDRPFLDRVAEREASSRCIDESLLAATCLVDSQVADRQYPALELVPPIAARSALVSFLVHQLATDIAAGRAAKLP